MSETRIAINGFGRIGRNLFRILYDSQDIRIAAISDPADQGALEYLIRFDTIFGPFPEEVSIKEGNLYVHGRQIPMYSGESPGKIPWGELGVDVVVEASGQKLTRAEMQGHLEAGAKRVILCAPPKGKPDATIVMGVNDGDLTIEDRVVSNASCTAHCAAPVVQILHEAFGIERAFLSTVHAYTNQQRLADVPDKDPRRGRAAAENIIPQQTNAARMVMELIPELEGRISGEAMNVPVPNGSCIDLVCWHEKPVTITAINEVVRTAASSRWAGILHWEDDPIVSSDIVRSPYSSTFDSMATMVLGDRISKTVAWYDNGWGYAHRVVDLINRFKQLEQEGREAA
jgi:glyceraldehyde 3-phosphate dehydrogenase